MNYINELKWTDEDELYICYVSGNVNSDYKTEVSACLGSIPNVKELCASAKSYMICQGINEYKLIFYAIATNTDYGKTYANNPAYIAWLFSREEDAVAFKLRFCGD